MKALRGLLALLATCAPSWALAADIDGGQLSVLWGVPFAGMLLSIALVPLAAPHFWHRHFGKVTAAWALVFLLPFAAVFGVGAAMANLVHALLAEYLPFVILLTALYTVSGGISENYLRWKGIDATLKLADSQNAKIVVIGSGKEGLPLILGPWESSAPPAAASVTSDGQPVVRPATPGGARSTLDSIPANPTALDRAIAMPALPPVGLSLPQQME